MSRIFTRAEWGAKYRNGVGSRTVGNLETYAHHSVTRQLPESASFAEDAAEIRTIERIGQQRFNAGMSYTFLIPPSGRIFEGASVGRISYHSGGGNDGKPRNTRGASICFVGNYENHPLTEKQIEAAVWLLQHGVAKGWWKLPRITEGHRDFKATACPGRHAYAKLGEINKRASKGTVKPTPSTDRSKIKVANAMVLPTSVPGNKAIQSRLKKMGYPLEGYLTVDGKNGKYQREAVNDYHRSQFYIPGVAFDKTWGRFTEGHYIWMRSLQNQMNKWKGEIKVDVDGDGREWTQRRVMEIMRRNHGGAYQGILDNIPGPVFCGMLGIYAHPGLRKK